MTKRGPALGKRNQGDPDSLRIDRRIVDVLIAGFLIPRAPGKYVSPLNRFSGLYYLTSLQSV